MSDRCAAVCTAIGRQRIGINGGAIGLPQDGHARPDRSLTGTTPNHNQAKPPRAPKRTVVPRQEWRGRPGALVVRRPARALAPIDRRVAGPAGVPQYGARHQRKHR